MADRKPPFLRGEEEARAARRITFAECLAVASRQPGLVAQFDRLRGTHLSEIGKGSPIELAIDETTGRYDEDIRLFIEFVWDCIWTRLPREERTDG